jgi:glycosyltransferase involved in cell wall biosynthesis
LAHGKDIYKNSEKNSEKNNLKNLKKNIVMACTHPYWSTIQVGSQHIARQFAKRGWQVHYFSAPVTPFHIAKFFNTPNEIITRFKCAFKNRTTHGGGAIYSYIPFSLISPAGKILFRDKIITHHWYQTMFPMFSRLKKYLTSQIIDLLYIDNLSYHFLLDQLNYKKSIFRIMDIHDGFPGWEGKAQKLAAKISEKTDLTVYSALGLKNYVDRLNPFKSVFVPNGVDFDLFRRTDKSSQRHPLLRSIFDPIILYTGMIDKRLDFRLIRYAAQLLPKVSFVFAGVIERSINVNNLSENIYFTGPVPHKELPWLMQAAVAGIIPFDVNKNIHRIKGIRPLKMFEYMAAGLPVITATWPELIEMDSPAWFYENARGFVDLISRAVNSQNDESAAIKYASLHDWDLSYKMMLDEL